MGRSVMYPCNAEFVVYMPFGWDVEVDDAWWMWEDFEEDIVNVLLDAFPACYDVRNENIWVHRECKAIVGNGFGYFYISEYCGLASLAFMLDDDKVDPGYYIGEHHNYRALGERWARQAEAKVNKIYGDGLYRRVGVFSNGEAIYERANV